MPFVRRREECITEVIVADTHFGSAYGLMPPNFQKSTGDLATLNQGQEYLWECWQHATKVLPRKFDLLVLNGDLTHGQNPKEKARDLTEADPEWQQRAAYEALAPLAERANKVYGTVGSEYHAGEAGAWEEQLCQRLGAVPDDWGHHARDWLGLNLEGVMQDIAHSQSVMTRYRSTAGERDIQFEALIADMKEGGKSHLMIRSHIHTHFELFIEETLYLSTLAFQLQTRYARRHKMRQRYIQKHIGIALVRLYPNRVGKDPRVAEVQLMRYNHPKWKRDRYEKA